MAAILVVQPETPFWDKLHKDEYKMLQEFYRRAEKIMRLETAKEAIHTGRSTLVEAPRETAPIGKSTFTKKNEDNKKRKGGDR